MSLTPYPFDGIIFDCNGTLVFDALKNGRYVPNSNICKWAVHFADRLPLAVGSGGTRMATLRALKDAEVTDLFDEIVTFTDVVRNKPAPDIFLEVSRRLGIPTDRLLVIDDSDDGIEAARQAGIPCVHVADANEYFQRIERCSPKLELKN